MGGFNNPVVGALALVRKAIRSPNYVPGTTGWTLNEDGTVEFNTLGGTLQVTNNGIFFYVPNAGVGKLRVAISNADGVDQYGNSYHSGLFINQRQVWATGPNSDTVAINQPGDLFPTLHFIPATFNEIARIYADGPNDKLVADSATLFDIVMAVKTLALNVAGDLTVFSKLDVGQDIKQRALGGQATVQNQTNAAVERQIGIISNAIPANDMVVGSSYKFGFTGRIINAGIGGPPTTRIRIYLGSGRVATTRILDGTLNMTGNGNFSIVTDWTLVSAGVAGTFASGGWMFSDTTSGDVSSTFGTTSQVVDTTTAKDIEITCLMSTASSSLSTRGLTGYVKRNVSG